MDYYLALYFDFEERLSNEKGKLYSAFISLLKFLQSFSLQLYPSINPLCDLSKMFSDDEQKHSQSFIS